MTSPICRRGGWHEGVEAQEQTNARADAFRTLMAAREDGATTLLVSHWAFILALTGVSLANGEWLEYDPSTQAPGQVLGAV